MPNFRSESFGPGDQSWLGSTHGIRNARTAVLDVTAFDVEGGVIPSGTPVNAADEGNVTPFTGGAGEVLGFLLTEQRVQNDERINVPVLRHGTVKVDKLPVPFTPPEDAGQFVFVTAGSGS